MRSWLVATLLAVAGFGTASAACAQMLVAPDEVVIYVHKDFTDADFVDGLVCELSRVLAEDRAALVAAHVLKDKPFGACNTVAMATR
jgi:hypothetical protein